MLCSHYVLCGHTVLNILLEGVLLALSEERVWTWLVRQECSLRLASNRECLCKVQSLYWCGSQEGEAHCSYCVWDEQLQQLGTLQGPAKRVAKVCISVDSFKGIKQLPCHWYSN